jgi:CheY-like chemotaxis protein
MKELHTILLVDDDPTTNFLHTLIIKKENCTVNVICKESAEEALVYLKTEEEHAHPELIFLDINMPGMNGWDFLDEYQDIEKAQGVGKVVVMLTTSLDPFDKARAKQIKEISEFRSKPLTCEMLREVLKFNFPKVFEHYA